MKTQKLFYFLIIVAIPFIACDPKINSAEGEDVSEIPTITTNDPGGGGTDPDPRPPKK